MDLKQCSVEILSPCRALAEDAIEKGGSLTGDQIIDAMEKQVKKSLRRRRQFVKKQKDRRILEKKFERLAVKYIAAKSVINSRHTRALSKIQKEQAKKIAALSDKNDSLKAELHYVTAALKREKCRPSFMEKQKERAKVRHQARNATITTTTVDDADVQIIDQKPEQPRKLIKRKKETSKTNPYSFLNSPWHGRGVLARSVGATNVQQGEQTGAVSRDRSAGCFGGFAGFVEGQGVMLRVGDTGPTETTHQNIPDYELRNSSPTNGFVSGPPAPPRAMPLCTAIDNLNRQSDQLIEPVHPMALSYEPVPAKRSRFIEREIELPTVRLPNELLAKILDLVDDPWLKIQCKRISKQFYKVIGNKQCWNNSDMIQVECSPRDKFVTINGRSFSIKRRYRALDELMTVVHTIRRVSFTYSAITHTENDLALLKAIFDRIRRAESMTLQEFTFQCTTRWYLPYLKPVFQFIRSCSPVLRSIRVVLDTPGIINNSKRQKLETIESMWSAIGTCNQLKHVFVAYKAYKPMRFIPLHPMSYHIHTALYSKHLKSLEIIDFSLDPTDEELFQLLQSLPLLEKLSLNMDPSEFADVLINHNLSIPVKELTFSRSDTLRRRSGEEFETDSFCQALDMHLIPNLMSLSNGRCPFDPVPIIERIFQFWSNQESHFLLDYNSDMCLYEFAEMLDTAVTEKDGSISAAQSWNGRKVYDFNSSLPFKMSHLDEDTIPVDQLQFSHCCLKHCLRDHSVENLQNCRDAFQSKTPDEKIQYVVDRLSEYEKPSGIHFILNGRPVCFKAWIRAHGMSRAWFYKTYVQ